jgi:hypothetical protein
LVIKWRQSGREQKRLKNLIVPNKNSNTTKKHRTENS